MIRYIWIILIAWGVGFSCSNPAQSTMDKIGSLDLNETGGTINTFYPDEYKVQAEETSPNLIQSSQKTRKIHFFRGNLNAFTGIQRV